ncbi:MAG: hypothetical protein FJ278_24400, partial [Planctomycetes bacterium]|nr:hypothetical protein [Planctomycetota bacterium]
MDHSQAKMKRFLRDLRWWLASLAVHGALLVALAGVTLGTIAPPRKEIKIRTEFVEIVERTKPVTLREYVSPTPPAQVPRTGEQEQASAFMRDTPATVMDAGQLGAKIRSLLKTGKATQFDTLAKAGADATLTIQKGRATTYEEVIDEFAIKIIEVVERRPLLIVFLFDESSSLMDDRKMINQKIDNVIKSLKSKVGEKELGRAHWAVVSFGTTAKVIQTATANLDQAKAAIA